MHSIQLIELNPHNERNVKLTPQQKNSMSKKIKSNNA